MAAHVPGLLSSVMPAMVMPRKTSSDISRPVPGSGIPASEPTGLTLAGLVALLIGMFPALYLQKLNFCSPDGRFSMFLSLLSQLIPEVPRLPIATDWKFPQAWVG
jgi:hypothetical protein